MFVQRRPLFYWKKRNDNIFFLFAARYKIPVRPNNHIDITNDKKPVVTPMWIRVINEGDVKSSASFIYSSDYK